jgi:hypothetical protein
MMEVLMNTFDKIQKWYKENCDGDWEHSYGVEITTMDNPGWRIKIDLIDTELQEKSFERIKKEINKNNWIDCYIENGVFKGFGDPLKLEEILKIFIEWAEN